MSTTVKFVVNKGFESKIATRQLLDQLGDLMDADMAETVPVLTGHLKSTLGHVLVDDEHMQVGASADYAADVELGTSTQTAQPYIRPSVLKRR